MIYGRDPCIGKRLEYVVSAAGLIEEVLLLVGDALSCLWGTGVLPRPPRPDASPIRGDARRTDDVWRAPRGRIAVADDGLKSRADGLHGASAFVTKRCDKVPSRTPARPS